MDESFNQWRNRQNEDSDLFSEDESDFVNDSGLVNSKSGDNILVPDSDEEVTEEESTKLQDKSIEINSSKHSNTSTGILESITESVVVPSSDDEEAYSISKLSNTSTQSASNKVLSFLSRKEEVSLLRSPITPLIRKTKKKKACVIGSDESSENESNYGSPVSTSGGIHSSTKLGNISYSRDGPLNAKSTDTASFTSESQESLDLSTLNLGSKETKSVHKKNNLIEDSESEEDSVKKEVILINSNSEDDDSIERSNHHSLIDSKTRPSEHFPVVDLTAVGDLPDEETEQSPYQSNAHSSRLDSLKLEKQKLQMNLSDIIKDIECTKVSKVNCKIAYFSFQTKSKYLSQIM